MSCRRHGSKPRIALWMLVAVADLAIIALATGVIGFVVLTSVVVLGGGVLAARLLSRRTASPAVEAVARRRA